MNFELNVGIKGPAESQSYDTIITGISFTNDREVRHIALNQFSASHLDGETLMHYYFRSLEGLVVTVHLLFMKKDELVQCSLDATLTRDKKVTCKITDVNCLVTLDPNTNEYKAHLTPFL